MPFLIIKEDITTLDVDVIVNAANTGLYAGGGVCGAIFKAAGYQQLKEACDKLSPISTGEAVITPGFHLPAKYIIHTAGPIYQGGMNHEDKLLKACYQNSLQLAYDQGLESIAFPLISSGIYGYPKEEAYQIAKNTIVEFLQNHEMMVYLCLFKKIEIPHDDFDRYLKITQISPIHPMRIYGAPRTLNARKEIIPEESFSTKLLKLIDQSKMSDSQFYHKANMDRRLFSKLRKEDYQPSKMTAISCCIALSLSLEESEDLLASAGYSLSKSILFDCIIRYCIQNQQYDIFAINDMLLFYDQNLLGQN